MLIYPCLQEARQIEQARAQLAADAARRDAQQQAAAREGRVAAQRQVSLLFDISCCSRHCLAAATAGWECGQQPCVKRWLCCLRLIAVTDMFVQMPRPSKTHNFRVASACELSVAGQPAPCPTMQAEAERLQRQQEEEGRARAAERHAKANNCSG